MNKEQSEARDKSIREIARREGLNEKDTEKAVEVARANPNLGAKEVFELMKGKSEKNAKKEAEKIAELPPDEAPEISK